MKFFQDLFKSMSANANSKISDPFLGAFLGSWLICNWEPLALLFFGDETPSQRIFTFSKYFDDNKYYNINSVLIIPFLLAMVYTFIFPWVSLYFKKILNIVNSKHYEQHVSTEIKRIEKQRDLNKQILLADPSKRFLERLIDMDIEKQQHWVELLAAKKKKRLDCAMEASKKAEAEEIKLTMLQMESNKKIDEDNLNRKNFKLQNARINSSIASARFPVVYGYMLALDENINEDGIKVSFTGLGDILARVFGYIDIQDLLLDAEFNNLSLAKVAFIKYAPEELARDLSLIAKNEDDKDLNADILYDQIVEVFEPLGHKLLDSEKAKKLGEEFIEDCKNEILLSEWISGPMAETDTIFDDVNINGLESFDSSDGFSMYFNGVASGDHRKAPNIPGQEIIFSIEVKATPIVGRNGLSDFVMGDSSAKVDDGQ